ncbi:phage NrS-1 polymerase family protein [Niameybacter massiliensis]|uniref:phage NrS-1 polymerase family protein n=1 Tax=Niameybacter massiliensis TaxID=1658108 RepID=UPI0006B5B4C1|nr:hypothetical protein [Niameybacter massiliensis]
MNYNNIPDELKSINRWLCYQLEPKEDGKFNKIPKNPHTGGNASSTNDNTWSNFDTALKATYTYGFSGLGFVLGKGVFGVDIDDVDLDNPIVDEVLTTLRSYAEISPSGKGIHIICYGKKPGGRCRKGNFECYDAGRFFTVTGNMIQGYEAVKDCTEAIRPLFDKYLKEEKQASTMTTQQGNSGSEYLSDSEVIEKASKNSTFNDLFYYGFGSGDASRDDLSLINYLIFWTNGSTSQIDRIYRQSALMRDKWDRRQTGTTYGGLTIEKALRTYTGKYYNPDYYKKGVS